MAIEPPAPHPLRPPTRGASPHPAQRPTPELVKKRSREAITRQLSTVSTHTLTYAFDRDGFYESLAKRLLAARPVTKRWRGHWLCKQLDEAAHALDPGTYSRQAQRPTREGLLALGFPDFMATVLGAGAGAGLNIALGETPMNRVENALRVLGALVCPNLAACPARDKVVQAFAAPYLAEQLRSIESSY